MKREVYVVGLISDTHGLVRPAVARVFAGVDLIVHAGDVGGGSVLASLRKIAPVEAVFGNVDDVQDPALVAERVLPIGELTLHVSHGHELARAAPELALARYAADIVVFGHTHRSVVMWTLPEGSTRKRVAVNPGAAGPRRFDLRPSVAKLTVAGADARVEIISLE